MRETLKFIGTCISYMLPHKLLAVLKNMYRHIYSGYRLHHFKSCGNGTTTYPSLFTVGDKYISLGKNVTIGRRGCITAYKNGAIPPSIVIGDNVMIGDDVHITAINSVIIGNDVLFGKKVTITDNSHGNNTLEELSMHPSSRPVVSKGAVYIGNRVWVGDKVTILPNVCIGDGVVIGANSVVTKSLPSNVIVAGNPARVVKLIE